LSFEFFLFFFFIVGAQKKFQKQKIEQTRRTQTGIGQPI